MPNVVVFLPLLAPVALLAVALLSRFESGPRPRRVLAASQLASVLALAVAVIAAVAVVSGGARLSPTLGIAGLGLTVLLDPISVTLFGLVSFVGAVVLRFSRHYLAGDERHGAFIGGLCLTLASVLTLVLAGNVAHLVLAWIATSLSLQRLLVFYRDRPRAQLAGRKKFVVARLADGALIGASALLVLHTGSGDIGAIAEAVRAESVATLATPVEIATVLIAVAALLKSAQFPTHGWLPEVMETPTPVSALLHAGIINAGGFLVVRFADIMVLGEASMVLLAVVGGFTALFGSVVMLTQSSVKVALAYSTVAQMGFMLFECGIGAYSIAMLHLVAHSLYKAHAFLASGSIIDRLGASTQPLPLSLPRAGAVLASVPLGFGALAAVAWSAGWSVFEHPATLVLASILALGLSHLAAQALRHDTSRGLLLKTLFSAALVAAAFAALDTGVTALFASTLPAPPSPGPAQTAVMVGTALAFFGVTALQMVGPRYLDRPRWRSAYVHLRNGLYVNTLFDRLVRGAR